jgi:hypothetical protein
MPVAEDAIKALKTAIDRQKATREATAKMATDIAERQASQALEAPNPEVK